MWCKLKEKSPSTIVLGSCSEPPKPEESTLKLALGSMSHHCCHMQLSVNVHTGALLLTSTKQSKPPVAQCMAAYEVNVTCSRCFFTLVLTPSPQLCLPRVFTPARSVSSMLPRDRGVICDAWTPFGCKSGLPFRVDRFINQ